MKLNDIDCIHSSHTLTTRNPRRDREAPAQLEAPARVEAMRATQQGTYLVRVEGKGANTNFCTGDSFLLWSSLGYRE